MTLQMLLALLFNAVLIAVCGYAAIRGGRPERIGAAINLSATAISNFFRLKDAAHLAPADSVMMSIDLAVVGGFFCLAITTIRFWPIWAAGFALSSIFMSVLGALLPAVPLFAYRSQLGIYAYLALGALALGTYRLPRNAEPHIRNGSRRSWLQYHRETN